MTGWPLSLLFQRNDSHLGMAAETLAHIDLWVFSGQMLRLLEEYQDLYAVSRSKLLYFSHLHVVSIYLL